MRKTIGVVAGETRRTLRSPARIRPSPCSSVAIARREPIFVERRDDTRRQTILTTDKRAALRVY